MFQLQLQFLNNSFMEDVVIFLGCKASKKS